MPATQVTGLRELVAAFKAAYPELILALKAELRPVMERLAEVAQENAIRQGLGEPGRSGRATGALVGGIRGQVTQSGGRLVDKTTNDGYPYPRRFEYEGDGARRFMRPAVDLNEELIAAAIEEAINAVAEKFNSGSL